MANTIDIKLTEEEGETLGKLIKKKIGALDWVMENREPKDPEKIEANKKVLENIQKKLG